MITRNPDLGRWGSDTKYLDLCLPIKVNGKVLYDLIVKVGLRFFDEILSFPEERFIPSKPTEFMGSHIQLILREFNGNEKINEFRVDIQTWGEDCEASEPICDFFRLDEEINKGKCEDPWKWVAHHSDKYPYLRKRFLEFKEALLAELPREEENGI